MQAVRKTVSTGDPHDDRMTLRPAPRLANAALVVLTSSLLAACAASTSSSAPPVAERTETSPGLAVADLDRLAPKDADDILPVLLDISGAAADQLLTRAGIVDLLPGAPEALDVLGAAVAEQAVAPTSVATTGLAGFRRSPHATGVAGPPPAGPPPRAASGAVLGLATLGTAIDGSLESGADGDAINGDGTVDFGGAVEEIPAVQMTLVDGTMDLRILQRVVEPVDGGEMSVELDLRGELDACPSADGTVTAVLSADVRIEAVAGASTASGRYTMLLDLSAVVDDAARLVTTVIDVSGSSSDTSTQASDDGDADIDGWFVEGGSRTTLAGRVADGLSVTDVSDVALTRRSTNADDAAAETFLVQQASVATALGSLVLVSAEKFWRGGACVDVQLIPAGDPAAVRPGDAIPVAIEATSAVDGQPIDAPATAAATATGGTATPTGTARELPADVVYAVPGDGSDGELTGQVTSRRGIGTSTLPFTVARALRVDGQLDVFHAAGTKCGGLAGAWELSLSADFQGYPFTGVLRFELSDTGTGTYTLVGSTTGGGITVDQSATGAVEAVPGPNGRQLIFSGAAWTGGPSEIRSIEANLATDAEC